MDEQVKKVEESINLKVVELKLDMTNTVENIENSYFIHHGKVDVIVDAIIKLVEYNILFSTKLEAKTDTYSKVFEKLLEFLGSLKEYLSKLELSQQSDVYHESISKMISSLETNLKTELAPLLKLVLLMPMNVPHVKKVVQGREKGFGSSKDPDQGKLQGR